MRLFRGPRSGVPGRAEGSVPEARRAVPIALRAFQMVSDSFRWFQMVSRMEAEKKNGPPFLAERWALLRLSPRDTGRQVYP